MADGWLTGWKQISDYTQLSKSTCKRYRKKYSMPVNYLPGGDVVALPLELDLWLTNFTKIKSNQKSNNLNLKSSNVTP